MADIEYKFPGAEIFLFYTNVVIFFQSDERQVDCWTANELAVNKTKEAKKILDSAMNLQII